MSDGEPEQPESQDYWRAFLSGGHSREHRARAVFKRIPSDPRCRLCGAPFAGPGAPLMRLIGKRPSTATPNWPVPGRSWRANVPPERQDLRSREYEPGPHDVKRR